jgi:hypothetical protein
MFKQRVVSVGSVGYFMNDYREEKKEKKQRKKADKAALASASVIPVIAFTPKVLAASAPLAMTAAAAPVAITTAGAMDNLAHIFDPLIQLVIGISFPVASAMILFKLFMGFFQGQDQVWEGVGKVALVYVLIQMFPVFSQILKNLGAMV